jgi:DNA-binding transcriptional MerR regulator
VDSDLLRPDLLRVEELARAADVSVDTIRFYQKRRLLPPPAREGRIAWYGPEHLDRLARIRDFQARGFSLAVIRRLLDGELDAADEPLAAAVVGAQAGEDAAAGTPVGAGPVRLLTLEDVATRAGIDPELLETAVDEGLLVPQRRDGRDWYVAGDVELVVAGLALLEAGFPLPELLDLAKRQHAMTRTVAEHAVAMFDTYVRQPLLDAPLDEEDKARRLVDAFRTLLPAVTAVVAQHFRRVLLEVAQERLEDLGDPDELGTLPHERADAAAERSTP